MVDGCRRSSTTHSGMSARRPFKPPSFVRPQEASQPAQGAQEDAASEPPRKKTCIEADVAQAPRPRPVSRMPLLTITKATNTVVPEAASEAYYLVVWRKPTQKKHKTWVQNVVPEHAANR